MKCTTPIRHRRSCRGVSVIELLIVIVMVSTFCAMSVPHFIDARKANRAIGLINEISAQYRLARQEAMSQLRAVTVQYDHQNKQLVVIRHAGSGTSVLTNANYPNNGTIVRTVSLTGGGFAAGDIMYGRPTGVPAVPLADNSNLTALPASQRINVTFQPDSSVIDTNGLPVDSALFFYNAQADRKTAIAVSVLGAAGRVKIWRYNTSANTYVE